MDFTKEEKGIGPRWPIWKKKETANNFILKAF